TAEVFTVDPFRQEEGGRLYKTGDIGRWLPDGNIEFLGRKDYQVKIRGFRIELGEIENQLVRHPLVKDAIVVERSKENNDKYLCAYIVKDTHPGATVNEHELREMLSFELPDYMIPDYFIELERFPLTPTGKCDRAALPEPCRTGLADIPYISDERLNQLKNQLEKESTGSKGGAEAHLDDAVHQAEVLKKFSNESGVLYYPLSHPQKMIYYSEKKYPNTGNANAVYLVRYSKILDQELLQKAVNIVLFKNQNLRLRVMEIEKDDDFFPAQYVAPYKEHALEKFDFSYERNQVLSTQLKEWVEKCSAKPFKLIDSDLFYFAYLIFNKKESGYFMNIHHVITDQWSCFLISVEINKIYHALESGREIGDSQVVSYFQYLRDEMDYLNSPRAAEDRKFWLNYLLPLPTEVNLSPIQSDGDRNDLEAKVHYSVFPFDLRSRMHRYCREHKTTLYKLILSALSIYISRTAGVNDFVVGTLNHNRSTPVHKEIVGTFISFVPIRVKVSQEKIFQDFVKEKGESINYVIKNHQRYPFDMLVAEIRERTAGDVDYFFNINLIGHPDLEEKDFKIKRLFQGYEMTPLTIHVNRSNKDIDGILELEWIFQVAKFSENDMKRIHNGLVNILENALNEPNKKISKLEMVSDREKKFILEDLGCREHSLPMHIIQSVMPELNEGRCFYTYILSPEGMVQPPGVPGELCLAFIDVEHRSTGNIRRTGQLARWLENEKIELLGDIHRQIWVDGRRLDAGRIESCLLSHKNVTQTVVVSRGGMGNKQLCAYIVLNGPVGKSRLVEYLTEKLPKHLIPEDIVQLQCFPLRSNGTIDIELLESLTIDTVFSKGIRPPRNETEWKMVDIWSWLLGIEKEQIGIGDNFFEIGGHSLKAIQLVTKIHKELNVRIPMAKIFEFPTIESLAEHIREIENEKFTAIEPAEKKNYYRLSSAQKRFYFLRQVDKTGTSYNMPRVITVEGELDRQWITDTFKLMIQRHESLRTSFHLVDENIFQRVHDEVEFEPEYFDLEAVGGDSISEQEVAAGIIQKFIKPFELSRAPLMRVGFVKVKEKRHLLMLDTHHIISDGVSTAIFLKEFKAFYSGEYLQPLRIQYRDYAEWQHNEKKKEEFMKQEAFWCSQFKGNIPVLNLPTDYRRPSEQNFEGKHVDFEIGMNETQAFNRLVLQEDVTLFMLFLAIYNVLLLKLSGQEDIVVGAPIAGRSHADLEQIIGIFVNTLVLRNFPSGEKTFIEFLHEVKEKTLSAFENQDYQYEDLVDQVVISRDANRNPLFDTMFVLQNIDIAEINIPGLKLKPYQYKNEVSKFDLALSGVEEADKLIFTFEYSTKLFREGTINRFIVYFKNIVTEVIEDKYKRISNFGIITVEEKKRILFDFNNTRANYPKNKTIHRLFEEQVERTPDHIAIFGHGRTRTITSYNLPMAIAYQELNEQSNRMACLLIEKGVLSDNIVGIMMERSCEMVISIYGILKAGGAYLPIDPDYPQERINYMMWDSGAKLLVTTNDKESEKMRRWEGEKVLLEKNSHFQKSASCPLNFLPSYSENSSYLAYVIYTSGTTGQSKGALIEHRNVVRLLFNDKFQFHFTNYDIWTLFHSFCFDFSVWEMYGALLYGGKLVIVPKMVARDTTEFLELLNRETVTVLNQTPSAFYNLINEVLSPHQQGKKLCIKYVIFGGEALNTLKLRNWLEKYPQTSLINMFGITETTVHVTYKELNEKDVELSISNIGKPIPTMNAYILDRYLEPVPIGVAGEIYVGGDGVARGYLNRVELTIGKFIKNPLKLGDRLYRSGDTGRYLENGDIEYLGRIDKQVKIRGFRIELGEIENELLKHDDINEAVVVAWESGELSNYLCAYIVCQSKIDKSELREYIGKQLPDYMIPSYFVHLDKIPLTPNGKVDYNALVANKENVMEDNKECIPPQNVVEKKLVDIWKKVLGREEVGINQNFFTIGGDSIKSIQIISRMRSAGYKLEMKDIFQYPVILNLAPRVKKLKRIPEQSIITGTIPLTPIQKAFFNESHIEAYHYNQAVMLYSREGFDKETIKKVFFRIQEHHDALRMIYKKYEVGGHVIQVNHGLEYPLYLEEQNLKNCENSLEELKTNANRIQASINLEKGPLMKLGLFHLNDGDRLLIVIHHLVIDGVSWRILLEDIETLYSQNKRGEKLLLPSKTDSFKFWSDKLLAYANSKIFLKQKTYWQKIESIDAPSSTIPKDFNVDDNYIKDTGSVSFTLRVEETELLFTKVNQIFKTEINDILLTALGISIKKTFGQDLVLVDMEGHGREEILEDMDIGRTVGWFTSVYPVLMDISYAGDTGRQIKEIKETLRRIPNKGIGYGILKYLTNEENKEKIEFKLKPQICFNYLGQVDADVKQLSSFEMAKESTGNLLSLNNRRIYLLNISGLAVNNRLTINISFNKTHFKPETMASLIGNLESELTHIIAFCSSRESIERTPSDFTYSELTI
ncbi:MAG TPA: amino acid adenylation domain-containing protein, partial [Candidatus Kapabacteria bacterium]|nr:amino acid adenylation domain-containing protein [Candidatus Kapabacteria bacterium]